MHAWHAPSIEALQAAVLEAMPGVSAVLVKGSRFMGMERVVQAVLAAQPAAVDLVSAEVRAAEISPQEQQRKI